MGFIGDNLVVNQGNRQAMGHFPSGGEILEIKICQELALAKAKVDLFHTHPNFCYIGAQRFSIKSIC